ncbi:hypothetical protein, partial [Ralstonia pseudosolanacearum]|uniref:hypothetical protein n=1 Tax=Ralstonia pseudosolanacearum TaxID=1310165 RepID=UPI003CEFCB35
LLAFILGSVMGTLGAIAAAVFSGLGWAAIVAIYFGIGYGLPLAFLAVASLIRPQRPVLRETHMARR